MNAASDIIAYTPAIPASAGGAEARKYALLAKMVDDQIDQEGAHSSFMVRAGLLRQVLAAIPAEQPAQASEVERIYIWWAENGAIRKWSRAPFPQGVEHAAHDMSLVAEVVELAQRDIARTQTDFLGRMGQALCTYEGIFDEYPDGKLPDDARQDAEEEISALAGLALAQLAMLRRPNAPAAALNPSQERAEASHG